MYRAQLAFLAIAFAVPAARAASTNGDPANASRDPVGAVPSVAARPAPTVGDTWVYRRVDLFTGLEMNRWQVRFVGSDTAGWHLKTAGGSDFVMTPDLGQCTNSKDIPEIRCGSPYRFPLVIGGKGGYEKLPSSGEYGHHSQDCVVAKRETLTVIAGTFDVFRVECRGIWVSNGGELGGIFEGQLRETHWYAPAVNNEVKVEIRANTNKGGIGAQYAIELVALKPGASTERSPDSSEALPARSEEGSSTADGKGLPRAGRYSGRWYGSVVIANGAEIGLEVVVAGTSGTYRLIPVRAGVVNACYGKEFPIRITSEDDTGLAFDVLEAQVTPGCSEQSVTLRKVRENRLEGVKRDGRAIKLAR